MFYHDGPIIENKSQERDIIVRKKAIVNLNTIDVLRYRECLWLLLTGILLHPLWPRKTCLVCAKNLAKKLTLLCVFTFLRAKI